MFLLRVLPMRSLRHLLTIEDHEDPFVDGLRGLSVLMVIIFHAFYAVNLAFDDRPALFQDYLAQLPHAAQFILGFDKAVDIFFMISAYLLGRVLLKQADTSGVRYLRFYRHRFFRIYPLFLLALLLYGLGDWEQPLKLLSNLLFVDNWLGQTIIPVGWSLSVEMQCYLLLPMVVALAARTEQPLLVFIILYLLALIIRTATALSDPLIYLEPFYRVVEGTIDSKHYMDAMYYGTPARMGSFIAGLVWAAMDRPHLRLQISRWYNQHAMLAFILLLISLTGLYISMFFPVYIKDAAFYQQFNPTLNLCLIVIHRFVFTTALLVLISLCFQQVDLTPMKAIRRVFSSAFFRPFSKMAFPIYLFHFPALALAWLIVLRTTDLDAIMQVSLGQTVTAAIIATLIVAWVSIPIHFLVERRAIAFGKRWD